ncbi:hypothetical protein BLNAU_5743 [Blattamonas nauphoetae]|uniref:Uncharacterized protein n=1 Tax=Blattamonas nauphoetae TaxID=2049346 RepID=A0ABQ9Y619_9EUKA|nr:hypothetical protein BLNAU_5743 [Blattamonas nauphoetae]
MIIPLIIILISSFFSSRTDYFRDEPSKVWKTLTNQRATRGSLDRQRIQENERVLQTSQKQPEVKREQSRPKQQAPVSKDRPKVEYPESNFKQPTFSTTASDKYGTKNVEQRSPHSQLSPQQDFQTKTTQTQSVGKNSQTEQGKSNYDRFF